MAGSLISPRISRLWTTEYTLRGRSLHFQARVLFISVEKNGHLGPAIALCLVNHFGFLGGKEGYTKECPSVQEA